MLAKSLFRRSIRMAAVQKQQIRFFSATDDAAQTPEPTKSEVEEGRKQWGIQYNDECLKFEKEWEILAQAVEDKQNAFIDQELGDIQKEKVNMLADKVLTLNLFEMRYF